MRRNERKAGFLAMMGREANYEVVELRDDAVVIRDVGPWDQFKTITNAPESVIAELLEQGLLRRRRIFYFDSEGTLDEIVVKDGKFAGFKPGPVRP
jgi:hypothetical protein